VKIFVYPLLIGKNIPLNTLNRLKITFVDFEYTTVLVLEKLFSLIRDIRKIDGRTETDNNIVSFSTKRFITIRTSFLPKRTNAVVALDRNILQK